MAAPSQPSLGSDIVRLRSADGVTHEVNREALTRLSPVLEGLIGECGAEEAVPLPSVHGRELGRVAEFCRQWGAHEAAARGADGSGAAAAAAAAKERAAWEAAYLAPLNADDLHDLLLAANFLHAEPLMTLCFRAVGDAMRGKAPAEIRAHFGIPNDFEPGEEDAIRRENQRYFS
mmetsp:Transcript_47635/g.121544  ORF Transcript_47635/g.121544 Transcript_47635/m.121544 type:complete len:175 (-) Transcript_47635:94-618(-)|eukprot:jgi/Tetstr1/445122/TSEL_032920.t1